MLYFLGVLSLLILIFLAVIHLYWTFGGRWKFDAVIPTDKSGKQLLKPKWIDSLTVAVGLFAIALLYAVKTTIINGAFLPEFLIRYGMPTIAFVFLIRAIGDFKYIGFFKKQKTSLFAKNDTYYFSPLCLFLAVIGFLLIVLKL